VAAAAGSEELRKALGDGDGDGDGGDGAVDKTHYGKEAAANATQLENFKTIAR
jgi:hypothetical protein